MGILDNETDAVRLGDDEAAPQVHNALQPGTMPLVDLTPETEQLSLSRQRYPIKMSRLQYPWWAVAPEYRPSHDSSDAMQHNVGGEEGDGNFATAEQVVPRPPWKLIL